MASAIQDYAIVGDGQTCALIAPTGSIDFLCWPRFDSDACLTALLGDDRHGHWRLAPAGFIVASRRQYRGDTAILETDHDTETGSVRITDFMPFGPGSSAVIRIVECLRGTVEMAFSLRLRFGYGRIAPWVQRIDRGATFEVGPDQVTLESPIDLTVDDGDVGARFTVSRRDRIAFVLRYTPSIDDLPPPADADALLRQTDQEWRRWIGRFDRPCRWPDAVKRSLVTLRMLIDRSSGGIVAAPTLGLPEIPGGAANWDYRYCWLRDSTFTLTALLNAGFEAEARRWQDWIMRAVAGDPAMMQIVYRIDGGRDLPEREADWLPGYQGATPVRIGNAASGQTQLDVLGELMDSFDVASKAGIERGARVLEVETAIVTHLEKLWNQPGADIWENRGKAECYTYSQAMAWVGIDRYVQTHRDDDKADIELLARLEILRDKIHRTVCERGFSSNLGHFVQHYESDALDASLLLLPLVGFLPIDDPRITGTIAAIERDLMEGGLVRRKAASADQPEEGAFLACSCWLADCYKMQGRDDKAAALLERVIGIANDVGLLSEEYDVASRSLTGNFPQALTHLAVINTALFLSGPVIQRAGG